MIDSHAHIYAEEFSADRDAMLEKCFGSGVRKIFMPNIDRTSVEGMLALEEKYPGQCYATMGLHPCYVNADYETELAAVESWLQKRRFAAVGEIGLDYYWSVEFKTQQEEAFRIQVGWAKKYRLPIIIHCRNSFAETVTLLRETGTGGLTGVFHCFTGNLADARQVIDSGFLARHRRRCHFQEWRSGPGTAPHWSGTPPAGNRQSLSCAGAAPGQAQPTRLPSLIAQRVADLKQTSLAEVDRITTENALKLFGSGVRSEE